MAGCPTDCKLSAELGQVDNPTLPTVAAPGGPDLAVVARSWRSGTLGPAPDSGPCVEHTSGLRNGA
jgi:hypothetical protein